MQSNVKIFSIDGALHIGDPVVGVVLYRHDLQKTGALCAIGVSFNRGTHGRRHRVKITIILQVKQRRRVTTTHYLHGALTIRSPSPDARRIVNHASAVAEGPARALIGNTLSYRFPGVIVRRANCPAVGRMPLRARRQSVTMGRRSASRQ